MKVWLERAAPWIALVVAAAAYLPRFMKPTDAGMQLYPDAARCILNNQVLQACEKLFTYPPAFAFTMIPFTPMPLRLRAIIWYVITIAASVACFWFAEQMGKRMFKKPFGKTELAWMRTISIILSIKFVLAVLENQAYDAFTLVFIAGGLYALMEKRDLTAGALLGFATAIKATPILFLPYLIVKGRFRAAAACVVVLLAVSYAPDIFFTPQGGAHGYFHTWLLQVGGASFGLDPGTAKVAFWAGANPLNHSLRGLVSLNIDEVARAQLHKAVLYGLDLALILFCAALILWRKSRRDLTAIDGSILLIATLALSPMTSRSHYIYLVVPCVLLTMIMLRDCAMHRLGVIVLGVSFILLTATSNDLVGNVISQWAYDHSLLVLGALSLYVYIAAIVWNPAVLESAQPFVFRGSKRT